MFATEELAEELERKGRRLAAGRRGDGPGTIRLSYSAPAFENAIDRLAAYFMGGS